ncbi:MAG: hypothetical protein NVS2B7_40730 [Herpetosiphon sp.]
MMTKAALTPLPGWGRGQPSAPLLWLHGMIQGRIMQMLPEPHAGLLTGILIGDLGMIPKALLQEYDATGTRHVLVFSGWNISVVVAAVLSVVLSLGATRLQAALVAGLALSLVTVVVGSTAAVLRGAAMGLLVILADQVGRPIEPWTLLGVACAVLTLWNPTVLRDSGFQLSAGATFGLIALAHPLTGLIKRGPFRRSFLQWTIEPCTATIAATVWILPLALQSGGSISLMSPLANVLILPTVPIIMALGCLALMLSMLALPMGQIASVFLWPLLQWQVVVNHFLATQVWAEQSIDTTWNWWAFLYYAGLIGIWWLYTHRRAFFMREE